MRKVFLILAALAPLLCLNSCSDDESEYYISSSSNVIEAGYEEGIYYIDIQSNCEWVATSDEGWIELSSQSGKGNTRLSLNINENKEYEERNADITISSIDHSASFSVQVKQSERSGIAQGDTSKSIDIPAQGGDFEIDILANTESRITKKPDWISLSDSRSMTGYVWRFHAEENSTGQSRNGYITISGGEDEINYSIYQKSIDILAEKIEFQEGESILINSNDPVSLTPVFYPENCNKKEISYKSSDESILKVDNYGEITPIRNGACIVSLIDEPSGKSASINVTVKIRAEKIIPISDEGYYMYQSNFGLNSKTKLNLYIEPENAYTEDIRYVSDNPSVIYADNGYLITNDNIGKAHIDIIDDYSGCTSFLEADINRAFFVAGYDWMSEMVYGYVFVLKGWIKGGPNDTYEVLKANVVDENGILISSSEIISPPSYEVSFTTGELNFTELFGLTSINGNNLPKLRFLVTYKWNDSKELYYEYVDIDFSSAVK